MNLASQAEETLAIVILGHCPQNSFVKPWRDPINLVTSTYVRIARVMGKPDKQRTDAAPSKGLTGLVTECSGLGPR